VECKWGEKNGVSLDHGKSEAISFSRRSKTSTVTIKTGGREIPFNNEATRWLRIWLDSHLTLGDHQRIMMKKGRSALARLRRLAGQIGLTSGNCRKIMTAFVQSVAIYGTELWWKDEGKQWHGRRNRGTAEAVQPGSMGSYSMVPDDEPWDAGDGIRTETSEGPVGQQAEATKRVATQPSIA